MRLTNSNRPTRARAVVPGPTLSCAGNRRAFRRNARRCRALACGSFALALLGANLTPAAAQNNIYTWTNSTPYASWLFADNWLYNGSNTAPPINSNKTQLNFTANAVTLATSNDKPTFILNNITVGGSNGYVTISNNALNFQDNGSLGAAIVRNGTSNARIDSALILSNNLNLTGTGTGTFDLHGNISGVGGIIQNNAGTTYITASSNTATGGMTVLNGTLVLDVKSGWRPNTDLTLAGGTFDLYSSIPQIRNLFLGNGSAATTGTLTDTANTANFPTGSRGAGTITLSGDIFDANQRNSNGVLVTAATVLNTDVQLASGLHKVGGNGLFSSSYASDTSAAPLTLSGVISGAGGLQVTIKDRVALTGANTYTGETRLGSGSVLFLGRSNALSDQTAVTVSDNAYLIGNPDYTRNGVTAGSYDQQVGSLSGTGYVRIGSTAGATSGNTLTMGGNNASTNWSGVIYDGALVGNVVKTGTGTTVFTGQNTYEGRTTVADGTLRYGNNNVLLPASSVVVNSGATLDLNGKTGTLAGLTSNGTTLLGGGTLTLGSLTGTGNVQPENGYLYVGNGNASSTYGGTFGSFGTVGKLIKIGTGTFTLNNSGAKLGTTAILDGYIVASANNVFDPSASLLVYSPGRFALNGTSQTVGALLNNGYVALQHGNLTLGNDANSTWSGNIYDDAQVGTVTKAGTGTVTFSARNDYTGQTTVVGGTLKYGVYNALAPIVTPAISDGATLDINGLNVTLGGVTGTGLVNLNGGTLTLGNNNVSPTFSGGFSNFGAAGGIVKTGGGTLILDGTGRVGDPIQRLTVQDGYFKAATSNLFAADSVVNLVRYKIDIGGTSQTFGELTGNYYVYNGSGSLTVGGSNTDATWNGQIYDGGSGNPGTLTKTGTGTWTLGYAQNYVGQTTFQNGTLRTGVNNAFNAATSLLFTGGDFDLNNYASSVTNVTFGDGSVSKTGTLKGNAGSLLNLSGNLTYNGALDSNGNSITNPALTNVSIGLASGTHTLSGNGVFSTGQYDLTLTGVLSGAGGVNVSGINAIVLAGANTYTGATTIADNSALYLAKANTLPSTTALTVGTGAFVYLNPQFSEGPVAAGSYNQSIGSLAGTGTVSLGNATLTVGGDNSKSTFDGTLTDGDPVQHGGLTKTGTGTLILGGYSDYTGDTTVSGGTLRVKNAGGLSDSTALTVASGSVFDGSSNDATFASLAGGGTVNNVRTLTVGSNNASTTFSGVLDSNNGSLTKTGTGTLMLTGNNGYTGGTVVSAGTLAINNTTGSGTGSGNVAIQSGAALVGTGSIAGSVTSSGTVSPGAVFGNVGTLTLNKGYTQSATGIFVEDLGGAGAGQFDVLTVKGSTSLAGTLQIKVTNGFKPMLGQTFDFLTYGSLTGLFTSVQNLDSQYRYTLVNVPVRNVLQLRVAAVPEPSLVVGFALTSGLGGLSLLRRRKATRV